MFTLEWKILRGAFGGTRPNFPASGTLKRLVNKILTADSGDASSLTAAGSLSSVWKEISYYQFELNDAQAYC
jgi:hypothetical protein